MKLAVPSMEEVRSLEAQNGLRVASTFSGCGGSCLGWRMAGYDVRFANDVDPDTWASYEANKAEGATLDRRSIREVSGAAVLEACGVDVGELDVLEGSPPCTQFSMLGSRAGAWGETVKHAGIEQRVDDLFLEFSRLLGETKPRAFAAENVEGLTRGVAKGYLKEIMASLRGQGYRCAAKVLDAQWLGVPQHRTRVIVVGVREDLDRDPVFPRPFPELVPALEALDLDGDPLEARLVYRGFREQQWRDLWRPVTDPAPTVTATGLGGAASSQVWLEVKPTAAGRGAPPKPERRRLSIDEVKGLCSFPRDFVLEGSYTQQWARLGNSVPPLMTWAIAEELAKVLT